MVVAALDRLGRSLSAVIGTVEALAYVWVLLRSLREYIDCSTPTGPMLAGIFTSLAEDEHELMDERGTADLITSVGRATIYRALAAHRDPGRAPSSGAAASQSEWVAR